MTTHTMKKVGVTKLEPTQKEDSTTKEKVIKVLGVVASALSVIMYVSYIPQIGSNLAGHPGNPIQPLAAMFNCLIWSAYGLLPKKKQWPIVVANVPGVFLAATAFVTALAAQGA